MESKFDASDLMPDSDGHIPALGFWCDCAECIARHEALASAAYAAVNRSPSIPAASRVRDPAEVVDIAEARQRAMPQPTILGVDLAEPGADRTVHLGDFRGQVPQWEPRWYDTALGLALHYATALIPTTPEGRARLITWTLLVLFAGGLAWMVQT